MYNIFGFPLCCNIRISYKQSYVFRCHIFFFQSQKFILLHWPAFAMTWWSDGAIFYGPVCGWLWCWVSLQPCTEANPWWPWMQLVGWWGGWLVVILVVEPQHFFLFGGGWNIELYIMLSSEHLAFFLLSEWKFVQYGCLVGYFARDSMKTEQSQPQQLLQNYIYIHDICIEVEIIDFSTNYSQKSIQTYAKHLLLTLDACSLLVI